MGIADTITYWATMTSIMCLGLVAFPISPRNSAIAVAHLVKSVGLTQLFVSSDPAMQRLCSDAQLILKDDGIELNLLPMLQYSQISDEGPDAAHAEEIAFPKLDLERTVCIYHSSGKLCYRYPFLVSFGSADLQLYAGSTSFPKPIYIRNRTFLQWTMAHGESIFSVQI